MLHHHVMVKRKSIVVKVDNLFASPLLIEEMFFNNDSIREECYRRQKNDPIGRVVSNAGGYQSENYYLPDEFFNDIMFRIEEAGNAFADLIGIRSVKMDNFWININSKHHLNVKHDHIWCQLSGAYYVKVPPNSGSIEFYHPMDRFIARDWNVKEHTRYSSERWTYQPKETHLYIFPSWLEHMVTPNLSNEDRISISFNFVSK